jgi:hypothetical protein
MKTVFSPRSLRWLLVFALALGCLPVLAAAVFAADGPVVASSFVQANFLFELAADRARMIQASIVFVAFGIFLLWWKH